MNTAKITKTPRARLAISYAGVAKFKVTGPGDLCWCFGQETMPLSMYLLPTPCHNELD